MPLSSFIVSDVSLHENLKRNISLEAARDYTLSGGRMANLVAEDGLTGGVEALGAHLSVFSDVDQVIGAAH